jgi:hypothetical protein
MKNFYYVRPTETSEADACSATFVAADHAKVILSARYQPHLTSPSMLSLSKHVLLFSGNDERGGHVDFENTR